MLFYDSVGPTVDLRGGENRREDYLKKNPAGQMPALELDDGFVLSEITAICEYLEELHPTPPLIGSTAQERAETRMWVRRIDLGIIEPLAAGFRYGEGLKIFSTRMHCIPHASDDLKKIAQIKLGWLNVQMEGKEWVCGARFTLADIMLFCFLDFGAAVGQPINLEFANLVAHHARMKARPSAAA